jgi:hypothetical protein
MKIYSSLTFTDIADYDHEAGVFPTLVWQVPADAVPGQEFYVGDFSTDAEGQVFWSIIKIIVEAHETNADFSSEVSRLYTQWEEVTFSTMMEADRFFDDTNEETEVQHIGIFERDMEFPANGVSMPVLTAADEAQYLNDNRLVTVGEVCKVGRCAGDTNLYEPTDYVVDNIVTYTV